MNKRKMNNPRERQTSVNHGARFYYWQNDRNGIEIYRPLLTRSFHPGLAISTNHSVVDADRGQKVGEGREGRMGKECNHISI